MLTPTYGIGLIFRFCVSLIYRGDDVNIDGICVCVFWLFLQKKKKALSYLKEEAFASPTST